MNSDKLRETPSWSERVKSGTNSFNTGSSGIVNYLFAVSVNPLKYFRS